MIPKNHWSVAGHYRAASLVSFWFLPPCHIAKCCSIKTKNCACFKAYKMYSYSVYTPFVSRPKSNCTSGSFSHGVVTDSNSPLTFLLLCSQVMLFRRPPWATESVPLMVLSWAWRTTSVDRALGEVPWGLDTMPFLGLFLDCTCLFHRSVILSYDHKYELFLAPFSPWVYF